MISVYDIGNEAYTANGDAVLHPSTCTMAEDAGGSYEISMTHPITDDGIWNHLVCGAIVKAPVPVPVIENAYVGQDVDVYGVNNNNTALREGPHESEPIYYQQWDGSQVYYVGDKVSTSGYSHRNYQCVHFEPGGMIIPPPNSTWWVPIPDNTTGDPVLTTLKAGTEVYYVEASGSYWAKVSTKQGIIGYVKNSQITFLRHETVEPVPPREVEDQLFRIYNVTINTEKQSVTVNARHVSYDLSGVILGECSISLAEPSMMIMRIRDAMLIPYRGEIATNLTGTDNGTYTGELSYKNGTQAILDPDKGVIPYFRAKLIRDNWDLFLMKNDMVDRGISLEYGKNLHGVSWKRASDQMINRVMPVAKNESGGDLFLPEQWIDSDDIDDWPVIIMEKLKVNGQVGKDDGTGTETTWTEANLLDHMRDKATERFTVDHVDAQTVEITVDFTLMGDTEEYKQYKGLEKLYMYDLVRAVDSCVGLNIQLQVSHIDWDCIRERYIGMKVGNVFDYGGRTVWGYNIGTDAIDYEKISTETIRRIISEVE